MAPNGHNISTAMAKKIKLNSNNFIGSKVYQTRTLSRNGLNFKKLSSISEKREAKLRLKPIHLLVKASDLNNCNENIMSPSKPKSSPARNHPSFRTKKNWSSVSKQEKPAPPKEKSAFPKEKTSPKLPFSTVLLMQYRSTRVDIDCPVCNAPFTLIPLLHQHLSLKHFNKKLGAMISAGNPEGFSCPDIDCSFKHKLKEVVTKHMSTNHLMAFDIAKKLFPDFSIPAPST